jgi:uncharacterized membrane protein HdeD (DUF308 family)
MEMETHGGPVEELQQDWWLFLLLGATMIVLGILAIGMPFAATLAVVTVLGLMLIVASIVQVVYAFKTCHEGGFVWKLVVWILYLVAGLLLLTRPLAGILTITLVLAVFFTVEGLAKIIHALTSRGGKNWGWMLFNGVVTLVFGLIIWSQLPFAAAWVLGLLVGIDLIIGGVVMLSLAMGIHATMRPILRPT